MSPPFRHTPIFAMRKGNTRRTRIVYARPLPVGVSNLRSVALRGRSLCLLLRWSRENYVEVHHLARLSPRGWDKNTLRSHNVRRSGTLDNAATSVSTQFSSAMISVWLISKALSGPGNVSAKNNAETSRFVPGKCVSFYQRPWETPT